MALKEEAMPCEELFSKEPQKRQEEIGSASSEDRQAGLEAIGERRTKEAEFHVQLGLGHNYACQTRRRMTSEKRERKLQYQREWYQTVKSKETPEQREKTRPYASTKQRVRETETPEERQRRLESARVLKKRARATETSEQRRARLEKSRKYYERKKVTYFTVN
ncbi:hypothetical protein CDAR_470631 [Caerostris darwini]|uniref:Uncharacterized protein n=1 Tax=Caerostris darwini TaxID=1538125 RepID=A0AAV4VGV9_9ARAC|nr:hypothetical protein CDAR_470631 [Caerostris darwini]